MPGRNTMLEITGKYASAKVFTDDIEEEAVRQIINLLDQPFAEGSHPRFMPDVHAGKGCTIGTTMHVKDKICPNLVGVDISCGMLVTKVPSKDVDFAAFDRIVHQQVPAGRNIHDAAVVSFDELEQLRCYKALSTNRQYYLNSIGTLGGGNHFVELDRAGDGTLWLVIHSGSRNLGKAVCEHYMKTAVESMSGSASQFRKEQQELIDSLKEQGRTDRITDELKLLKAKQKKQKAAIDKDLAVLTGNDLEDYLHDCAIINRYAKLNRETMAKRIFSAYGWDIRQAEQFHTIHNYVDTENRILRKGAISAAKGEKLIIPLNMKDGCIIGIGKGNPDWNESGPHGAGRRMSRSAAKQNLKMSEFKTRMEGVYSTTVNEDTLDEAPMAYKNSESIIENVSETVDIIEIIKPVYNFKASE